MCVVSESNEKNSEWQDPRTVERPITSQETGARRVGLGKNELAAWYKKDMNIHQESASLTELQRWQATFLDRLLYT